MPCHNPSGRSRGETQQMLGKTLRLLVALGVIAVSGLRLGWAGDLKLTFPKRSVLTPVQRLNREGVEAIRKHQYDKAETLFYKAYLYDPADPFTLNNLGYVSEMQGELERAQKFYALASEQGSNASIERSNVRQLEGKPLTYALNGLKGGPMQVNQMNVEAVQLLSENRGFEADSLLQKALSLDPQNAFTLNNLGVAREALGDYESALKFYTAASNSRSSESVVVTLNHASRGKPINEVAAESARRLKERMQNTTTAEAQAAMLTIRGVLATNRNDWSAAKEDFQQAYSLNPESGFSLNNAGYVAERSGDLETAQFFYQKARKADDANARVGLATESSAEGKRLVGVAADSDQKVQGELDRYTEARRQQSRPIELKRRGSASPQPDASPEKPPVSDQPPSASQPPQ